MSTVYVTHKVWNNHRSDGYVEDPRSIPVYRKSATGNRLGATEEVEADPLIDDRPTSDRVVVHKAPVDVGQSHRGDTSKVGSRKVHDVSCASRDILGCESAATRHPLCSGGHFVS